MKSSNEQSRTAYKLDDCNQTDGFQSLKLLLFISPLKAKESKLETLSTTTQTHSRQFSSVACHYTDLDKFAYKLHNSDR